MTSPAHSIANGIPALLAILLVLVCALPTGSGVVHLTPNVAWLMTLTVAAVSPGSFSPFMAFALGLLQDVLFATPLGAQALLTLCLWLVVQRAALRQKSQPFRMRWLEATCVLVFLHGLLWLLMAAIARQATPAEPLLIAGLASALWYPAFYWCAMRMSPAMLGGK
jgi:rod shape-determining protein MreD